MRNMQSQQRYEIGMVGLGVMGRNLMLNMADHGFSVAGYDKDLAKVEALRQESKERDVRSAADIKEFVGLLRRPRAVMFVMQAIIFSPQVKPGMTCGGCIGSVRASRLQSSQASAMLDRA